MRNLLFALLALSSTSVVAQHYVSEQPRPVSKKIYENKPQKKMSPSATSAYREALLNEIHRRVRLYEYHRGKSCGLTFDIDIVRRQLLELRVFDCTMGSDFEHLLPQILSQAIYVTPIPHDSVASVIIPHQHFIFVPRFNGAVKSNKPSSFSKTYVTPQK